MRFKNVLPLLSISFVSNRGGNAVDTDHRVLLVRTVTPDAVVFEERAEALWKHSRLWSGRQRSTEYRSEKNEENKTHTETETRVVQTNQYLVYG